MHGRGSGIRWTVKQGRERRLAFSTWHRRVTSRGRSLALLPCRRLSFVGKVRRVVAQLKQAEACRARLEQRCRFEGGGDGDEDASLLHHWVEELDEFEEGERAFMDKMRWDAVCVPSAQ